MHSPFVPWHVVFFFFFALVARQEVHGACSGVLGTAYNGAGGCAAGQYHAGRKACGIQFEMECSVCVDCPVGRHRAATIGCSFDGIEVCCETGTHYVSGRTSLDSGCSGVDADCPAGHWCPGNGTRYSCHDAEMASTGLEGQDTKDGACTVLSATCKGASIYPFKTLNYHGCGENQYTSSSKSINGQVSYGCTACPTGRYRESGCRIGFMTCCSAEEWDGSTCHWTTTGCPAGNWCPGDGSRHSCYDVEKASTGLAGQATEDLACTDLSNECKGSRWQTSGRGCGFGQYQIGPRYSSSTLHSYTFSSICAVCPVGLYKDTQTQYDVSSAWAGTGCSMETECTQCDAGKFQDQTGQSACKACPEGYEQKYNDPSACSPCTLGTFFNATTSTCYLCPSGQYQDEEASTSCKACPEANPYTVGLAARDVAECTADDDYRCCDKEINYNRFYLDQSDNATHKALGRCPRALCGTRSEACCKYTKYCWFPSDFRDIGATVYNTMGANGCGAGQYSAGRETCPGSTDPSHLCSTCEDCPAGRYKTPGCTTYGSWFCLACPSGTYQDQSGQTGCKACPVGFDAQSESASLSCTLIPALDAYVTAMCGGTSPCGSGTIFNGATCVPDPETAQRYEAEKRDITEATLSSFLRKMDGTCRYVNTES